MKDEKSRSDGRADDEIRPVIIRPNYLKSAHGSVLIEAGDTKVICTASIESRVPPFLHRTGKGWVTAEYGMLPASASSRMQREASKGKQGGRTLEIQRLIGRALRAAINFESLGERTVWIDCDVIQADGGTRTAAITGAFVAMSLALAKEYLEQRIVAWPVEKWITAISVGIVDGRPLLDLNYVEDSSADVDMNVVADDDLRFVELQGTAEGRSFTDEEATAMISLAKSGIQELLIKQKEILDPIFDEVNEFAIKRFNKKFKG